ncbi:hypothetical protein [Bartonella tribocorum]|uniref:Uncharacterized protein n=1 Tax=Bartonella tribocorum TaxID=85701 RepID=A0A2M6USM8_9HYPH|nr:hypothetical protein [Bartonella tribocorum]PIT69154.1 hypothetical protein CEV08_06660 [Bartonella tribocorum]
MGGLLGLMGCARGTAWILAPPYDRLILVKKRFLGFMNGGRERGGMVEGLCGRLGCCGCGLARAWWCWLLRVGGWL